MDEDTSNVVDIKRDAKGRVLPGQSLNPKGGNKPQYMRGAGTIKYRLEDLYRDNAGKVFAELMKMIVSPDTPPTAKISAIKEFHDRHLGRPQTTTVIKSDENHSAGLDLTGASDAFLEELTRLRASE